MPHDASNRLRGPVIAIDGPAASGKSSTADAVARALGLVHIDSGSLYRGLAWLSVEHGITDPASLIASAESLHLALHFRHGRVSLDFDGVADVEEAIRSPAVNATVSAIAAAPALRNWVNRQIGTVLAVLPGAVIDGRDIGTVVVPDAELKVYLTATPAARAGRRLAQRGGAVDPARLAAETALLADRDRLDAGRPTAPLAQAVDAEVVDTTVLSFAEQVARIVELAARRGLLPHRQGNSL